MIDANEAMTIVFDMIKDGIQKHEILPLALLLGLLWFMYKEKKKP